MTDQPSHRGGSPSDAFLSDLPASGHSHPPPGAQWTHGLVDTSLHIDFDPAGEPERDFDWVEAVNHPRTIPADYKAVVQSTLKDIVTRLGAVEPMQNELESSIRDRRISEIAKKYHLPFLDTAETGGGDYNPVRELGRALTTAATIKWIWLTSVLSCQDTEVNWLAKKYQPTEAERVSVAVESFCDTLCSLELPGLKEDSGQGQTLYQQMAALIAEDYQKAKESGEGSDVRGVGQVGVTTQG